MKSIKKVLLGVIILATMLMLSCTTVFAASKSQDGISVSISKDKSIYEETETVSLTLKIVNNNDYMVRNISIERYIPKELSIESGDNEKVTTVNSLNPGEEKTLLLKLKKTQSNNVITKSTSTITDNNATSTVSLSSKNNFISKLKTGDYNAVLFYLLIFIIAFILLVINRKKLKDIFSVFIVGVLLIPIMLISLSVVTAKAADNSTNQKTINLSEDININNKIYNVSFNVKYTIDNKETEEKDEEAVNNVYDNLDIKYSNGDFDKSVCSDIILDSSVDNVNIAWSSNNEKVVTNDGKVTRPLDNNVDVKLTATISKGKFKRKKEFLIRVIKVKDRVKSDIKDNSVAELESMNEKDKENFKVEFNEDETQVTSIDGKFSDIKVESYTDALDAIYSVRSIIGLDDPESQLKFAVDNYDEYGTSYTFNEVKNGVTVFGRTVTVSADINGTVDLLTSSILSKDKLNINSSISSDEAYKKILDYYGGNINKEYSELVIYSIGNYEKNPITAYYFNVTGLDKDENLIDDAVLVNAESGEIIKSYPISRNEDVKGIGENELGDTVKFPVLFSLEDQLWYMKDCSRKITCYKGFNKYMRSNICDMNNEWHDKTINSAYTNLISVYDWYKSSLNRRSVDNKGKSIDICVHAIGCENNAMWYGSHNTIYFGDNTDSNPHTSAAARDVVAHEFTHGVVQYMTNNGLNEPGAGSAINEGYADIFGCIYDGNWIMGEDWKELRDIINPAVKGNAAKIDDKNYYDYTEGSCDKNDDFGECHRNSTIVSHCAFLMKHYGMSIDNVKRLWYNSLTYGYDCTSDFYTVRRNVIKAAKHLNFSTNDISIIEKSFDEVNIREDLGIIEFSVVDSENSSPINADIKIYNDKNELVKSFKYDIQKGHDYKVVNSGSYRVEVTKSGYESFVSNVQVASGDIVPIKVCLCKADKVVMKGKVINDVTLNAVGNANMYVRAGSDNKDGNIIYSTITNQSGEYSLKIKSGYYTVEISEEGYIKDYFNIIVDSETEDNNCIFEVSPEMTSNKYTIVLSWGNNPVDLNANLVGELSDGSTFYINHVTRKAFDSNGNVIASLDKDVQTGFGTETITFTAEADARYAYFVSWKEGTGTWGTSNAVVAMYNGDTFVNNFNVPVSSTDSSGLWIPFSIKNNIIQRCEVIEADQDPI